MSPVCFERSTGMPLPDRRKRRPAWVPAGTLTRAWLPSMAGTSNSPPKAAVTMEIGHPAVQVGAVALEELVRG